MSPSRSAMLELLGQCRQGDRYLESRLVEIFAQCRQADSGARKRLLQCYQHNSASDETQEFLRRCESQDAVAWQQLLQQAEEHFFKELRLCNLIRQCQGGDEDACVELAREIEPKIKGLVMFRSYNLTEEDTQDLCQEALGQIFRALPVFDETKGSFENFWRLRVNSLWADSIRRLSADKRIPRNLLNSIEAAAETGTPMDFAADGPGPNDHAACSDEFKLLHEALERLGSAESRCRQLYELFYFEERSYDEIGGILHMNPKTVSTTLIKCREKLRQCFSQKFRSERRDFTN